MSNKHIACSLTTNTTVTVTTSRTITEMLAWSVEQLKQSTKNELFVEAARTWQTKTLARQWETSVVHNKIIKVKEESTTKITTQWMDEWTNDWVSESVYK